MRVFVAYGYLPQEEWVRHQVVPILKTLDVEVVDGREVPGEPITAAVVNRIDGADALVGFRLRRQKLPGGYMWTASQWVEFEIHLALLRQKPVIHVIEAGVEAPGGELSAYKRLLYDARARDQFLVELTTEIRRWVQGVVLVRLDGGLAQVLRQANTGLPWCDYTIRDQSQVERTGRVQVLPRGDDFYVKLVGFQPGRFADLTIQTSSGRWWCAGVGHRDPFVTMTLRTP